MIKDVKIIEHKVLKDDRGMLMEILRSDSELFKQFGQAYMTVCSKGVAKAWHYHKIQTDNFTCVAGVALVVLCDLRENSPTYGETEEFILESPTSNASSKPILLQIPHNVQHGFCCYEGETASILNIPTELYNYTNPDEYRLPWDSTDIPYKWPKFITRGG